MAMSRYTGGGFNYTSSYTPSYVPSYHTYYVPPTPRPNYSLDSRHSAMSQWNEERRQKKSSSSLIPALSATAAVILDQSRRRRKKKGHSDERKRRELEDGVMDEEESQLVEEMQVGCGDDVTLPCRAPGPDSVDGLEWTRTDLDRSVYLFRDGKPELTDQHRDYRGRCELKDGTASLTLRNVTIADRGVYECRFIKHADKRAIIKKSPVSVIRLRVRDAGACAEGEEEGDMEEVSDGDEDGEDDVRNAPMKTDRHHYVVAGVVGVYGLVISVIALVFFVAL